MSEATDFIATTAKEIELRAALADVLSGWRYIRERYGDLHGVGWDRAQVKAEKALGLEPGQSIPAEWWWATAGRAGATNEVRNDD